MQEIKESGTYKEFKSTLDTELGKAAEGFVKIGYLLRIAKDTDILRESGYTTVADFAKAEYGLTKDIVSRYIAINERFSENGYSEKLKEEYKGYGVAKLAEMLTLPDSVIESMSPLLTRSEIQEVKKEIKEEEKVTDIEVILEGQKKEQQDLGDNLLKTLHQYFYDWREKYCTLWEAMNRVERTVEKDIEIILDIMAPSGIAMLATRVQGVGRLMLSIKGKDNNLEVINIRENSKEVYTWPNMIESLEGICKEYDTARESWEQVYGEKYEVAPVQPKEEPKQEIIKEVRKEPEVKKVESKETEEKIIVEKEEVQESIVEEDKEDQIPGQAYIDDYEEVVPDQQEEQTEVKEDKHIVIIVEEEKSEEEGCKFCKGEEVIASHDGDFTLKVTERGYISVKFDNGEHQESAIFELKRCPECGKLLREE